ncbi:AMP-binding protein [Desulfogranum japonicum]|uniref:AMP-binding protein n=1 Tax=Desulfogranum japonicum TaxID=231447 RepID=UPI000406BBC6|nr:class I adenylate-forming enzyme family protein [Desulfogranum japonicum]
MTTDFQRETEHVLAKLIQKPEQPDREFIYHGTTRAEVYAMAGRILSLLQGGKKPDSICLAVENKAVIAAAILASLGGGPDLLLPFALSGRALHEMHKQGLLDTIITDVPRDIPRGSRVISMEELAAASPVQLNGLRRPDTTFLHLYTGGSTGAPQLWPKTPYNLVGEGVFHRHRFSVTEQDVILATIPPYHIYGLLFSVIMPLVSSAAVIDETPSFPGEIVSTATACNATIMASVPAHYRALGSKALGLRLAFSSAGMLPEQDNTIFCKGNTTGIIEVYGSTETGGIATRNRSKGEEAFTPFASIEWKVKNECLAVHSPYISSTLPVDEHGFFTAQDRVAADGPDAFRLQGRADTVIKVGGKRVDLDTISSLIKARPDVIDCVVTSFADPGGRESWIGALVEGEVEVSTLKQMLAEALEPYALPRCIRCVDHIPVKSNGKYDREAINQLLNT